MIVHDCCSLVATTYSFKEYEVKIENISGYIISGKDYNFLYFLYTCTHAPLTKSFVSHNHEGACVVIVYYAIKCKLAVSVSTLYTTML